MQKKTCEEDIQNFLAHIAIQMNKCFLVLNQGKAPPSIQSEIIIRGIFNYPEHLHSISKVG